MSYFWPQLATDAEERLEQGTYTEPVLQQSLSPAFNYQRLPEPEFAFQLFNIY